jgi:glycopeptide antibiotics resistance protein
MLTRADLTIWALLVAMPILTLALWRTRPGRIRVLLLTLFTLYLAALAGIVLGDLPFDRALLDDLGASPKPRLGRLNLMPFWFVDNLMRDPSWKVVLLTLGNLLLMVPLGLLLPMLWHRFRRLREVAVAGLLTSLTIELIQLGISTLIGHTYRLFEVDDLILNTAGAMLGWLIWRSVSISSAGVTRSDI